MELPHALWDLEDFAELTPDQVTALAARYRYMSEIRDGLTAWCNGSGKLRGRFLADLELDLLQIQIMAGTGGPEVSPWIIHHFWVNDEPQKSLAFLGPETQAGLNAALPSLSTSSVDLDQWLTLLGKALDHALTTLEHAQNPTQIPSLMVALDTLISRLLAGVQTCHFLEA